LNIVWIPDVVFSDLLVASRGEENAVDEVCHGCLVVGFVLLIPSTCHVVR
jgi:hypothetical protein